MLTLDAPDKLKASLKLHEGYRLLPYTDTTGNLTIGVGHNLTEGLPAFLVEDLLSWDILTAVRATDRMFPWVAALDDVRRRVFVELVFNLGGRLLGFHDTLAHARAGRWRDAATSLLDSLWARQVGSRAQTLADMLATGRDPLPKP